MVSDAEPHHKATVPHAIAQLMQSASANLLSRFTFNKSSNKATTTVNSSSSCSCSSSSLGIIVSVPNLFTASPMTVTTTPFSSHHNSPAIKGSPSSSSVSIEARGGGPAFVGQVFSMCDPSGTGLMAVTSHFNFPFLSQKRTPEWVKKMLAVVTKSEMNGPVFRFFMELGDAVAYVKQLNIPTSMVGSCRLDVAYEHFKEKPNMFQFVPNEKQVKTANKLLKAVSHKNGTRRVAGVPVFTALNLNIAIATAEGIKWYTPYFFDKRLLDNILDASMDQHFHTLIQSRHMQRRRDAIDDNLAAGVVEENVESMFEPPEVQEVLDEIGHPGVPLSVVSKIAEIQLLDVVDKVLLGNRWLRKATGIQPKFPYLVDSFEERSSASFLRAMESIKSAASSESGVDRNLDGASKLKLNGSDQDQQTNFTDFRLPFGAWLSNPWSELTSTQQKPDNQIKSEPRMAGSHGECNDQVPPNPLLPKITMVGISTGERGQMSRASLKRTMEGLTRELEQTSQIHTQLNEDKDPLFVANVGDYSSLPKTRSA